MGSSASKFTRKLPTSTVSQVRPAPSLASRIPHPDPIVTEPPAQSHSPAPPEMPASSSTRYTDMDGREAAGQPIGKSKTGFSGRKDETVRRDGLDPGFSANLSAIGPVAILNAGKFMRTASSTQRTLNARRDEYTSSSLAPPAGYLATPILEALFDRLKSLPAGMDRKKVYDEFGVDEKRMEEVRRWVNSPSVGGEVKVRMINGDEVREMRAIWVESSDTPSTAGDRAGPPLSAVRIVDPL